MPSNYPSFLLTTAFAENGTKTLPPATAQQAGLGRFSQAEGFGVANERPLKQGGVPPSRSDFNGIFNVIGKFLMWFQRGGIMRWDASLDYEPGCEVLHNGTKYRCILTCTNVVPTNRTYWKNLDDTVPNGAIMCFGNLAGISNKHPIFNGQSSPDESWYLCDGTNGTPDLRDRFIMGGDSATLTTGGANSRSLTEDNLPAHSHTVTVASAGAHTHTRGTMEIEGQLAVRPYYTTGAFYSKSVPQNQGGYDHYNSRNTDAAGFKASNSWEGATSSEGAHTHTTTVSSTGSGTAFDNRPAFVKMAYFMKVNG